MTKISNLYGLTNYVTANSSGNVVIAAPTSGTALYVTGSAQVTGQLTLGSTITNGTYTYTLPSATGTLALASSLGSYLPLTGGTLTGALNGTSGTFTGNISTSAQLRIESSGNAILVIGSRTSGTVFEVYNSSNILRFYNGTVEALKIETGAGAATFSSSVTATSVSATDATGSAILTTNGGGEGVLSVNTANPLRFFTNGSEKMRITSGGNVGIGTSSPSQKLHLTGSGNVVSLVETAAGSFAQYQLLAGSGGTPWIFGTQVDYLSGSLVFRYSTNKMVLTTGGNLGIGTDSPGEKFWVNLATNVNFAVGGTTRTRLLGVNDANNNFCDLSVEGSNVLFYSAGAERMRITSGGNVGIGLTNPTGQLSIKNQISNGANPISSYAATNGVDGQNFFNGYYASNTDNLGTYPRYFDIVSIGSPDGTNGGSNIRFFTNPIANNSPAVERMRITSAGNMGIGNGSSYAPYLITLNVTGGGQTIGGIDNSNGASLGFIQFNAGSMLLNARGNGDANNMLFTTGGSERMRISSNGDVSIGTSSSGRKLSIEGAKTPLFLHNTNNTSGSYCNISQLGGSETNSTSSYYLFCDTDYVGVRAVIYGNGNMANVNNSYGTYSDIALKENIIDATPKLNDLLQLKVRNFNLIADNEKTKQIGFIAQELEEIFPSMIEIDGNSGMKTIKTSVLVPMLVKAVQELKAELDTLKNK